MIQLESLSVSTQVVVKNTLKLCDMKLIEISHKFGKLECHEMKAHVICFGEHTNIKIKCL